MMNRIDDEDISIDFKSKAGLRKFAQIQHSQTKRSYRKPVTPEFDWRPQGDSNPCYRRERAVS
jgi:hypothetical protein